MKRLIIILTAAFGTAFFTLCEEDISSLSGTTWKLRMQTSGTMLDGELIREPEWHEHKLTFASTDFVYTITFDGHPPIVRPGTYVYDPPTVTITNEYGLISTGTVNRKTLDITIMDTPDVFGTLQFKKQ